MANNNDYLKLIVLVITTLIMFIGALTSAFFGGAGLFYGQGVYENSVMDNSMKYVCTADCGTQNATYDKDQKLDSYTNYETFRDDINGNIFTYMNAYTIVFSLLGLVFLFLALREIGVFDKKKEDNNKNLM